jgi:hypothetical protein
MTDDRYDRITWHDGAKTVDKLTAAALTECERRLGYSLTVVQGSYNTGVGASAGTHDGGGVVDLMPWDWENKVHTLRAVGWAAWHRPTLPGVWGEHIHAVLIGNEKMSPAARAQVTDYYNHRDGLASHNADPFWHPNPIPVFKYDPKPPPPPKPEAERLPVAHVSMQFSDTTPQKVADAKAIFGRATKRGMAWVTGTEASEEPLATILRDAADAAGYRFHVNRTGQWIAVDRGLIKGDWKTGYVPAIESNEGTGRHTDRGVTWVAFQTAHLGIITVGCGHKLTDGRKPGQPNYELNRRYSHRRRVGTQAGVGSNLVFYHGDQNDDDRTDDTFDGQPFTSAQDELGKHESTGHGPIDVIATYNHDGRVSVLKVDAKDDSEFPLHTDHYFVTALLEVKVLAA